MVRIDNGRGIIADWLASIIREENDISLLETAAGWGSRKYTFTDRLLDARRDRSLDHSSNVHAIRETALKVMVNAILPSGISSGNAGSENAGRSAWNEK